MGFFCILNCSVLFFTNTLLFLYKFNILESFYSLTDNLVFNFSIKSCLFSFIQTLCMTISLFLAMVIPVWFNPIYSLLGLVSIFFSTMFFLSFLKVKFLSLIFILVYVGGLVVLFLFIIIFLSVKTPFYNLINEKVLYLNFLFSTKLSICSIVLVDLTFNKTHTYLYNYLDRGYTAKNLFFDFIYFANDSLIFNNLLYSEFSTHFIILSFILLVGMLGSIALCLVEKN